MVNKFKLGQTVATPGALSALREANEIPLKYLVRHASGDWGVVEEPEVNDLALIEGGRLFSVYTLPTGVTIWVITEADRSSTCILLPEEY